MVMTDNVASKIIDDSEEQNRSGTDSTRSTLVLIIAVSSVNKETTHPGKRRTQTLVKMW